MTAATMPLAEILQLRSADWPSCQVREVLGSVYVDDEYYQRIKERMREIGTNLVPVLVDQGWLNNGHHRVKLAIELEFTEMRITDNGDESGWDDCEQELVI